MKSLTVKRISVRIYSPLSEEIDNMMENSEHKNISDLIRAALEDYVSTDFLYKLRQDIDRLCQSDKSPENIKNIKEHVSSYVALKYK